MKWFVGDVNFVGWSTLIAGATVGLSGAVVGGSATGTATGNGGLGQIIGEGAVGATGVEGVSFGRGEIPNFGVPFDDRFWAFS